MPSFDASSSPGPVFQADAVSVRRGGRLVLDAVSCAAPSGRVLAVLGPNGAGTSTLLRLIAGEFAPVSGGVAFAGRPLASWPLSDLALRRAVVGQHSELAFPFTAREVVLLGRTPHPSRGDAPADRAAADRALAAVDMAGRAAQDYPTLSGGERQRVHFARALAQLDGAPLGQRALLLDEPTASLDLAHQHGVLALARRLARQEDLAVLIVLHDLNLALAYSDDVLVLQAGRVVAAGPVAVTVTSALVRTVFGITADLQPSTAVNPASLRFQTY
jgi:iron complex transport system ATP-binding protein